MLFALVSRLLWLSLCLIVVLNAASISPRHHSSALMTREEKNETPWPVAIPFNICLDPPVDQYIRVLPADDTALLILQGIRDLALESFAEKKILPPFQSPDTPDLTIAIRPFEDVTPSIETQLYAMWNCWTKTIRFLDQPIAVLCFFGGRGTAESAEGKLRYITTASAPAHERVVQVPILCHRAAPALPQTERRDLDQGVTTGEESQLSKRDEDGQWNDDSEPPPIDYTSWANITDDSGTNKDSPDRPEYYTLIGDFTGPYFNAPAVLQVPMLALIHLAKTTPMESHDSMPPQSLFWDIIPLTLKYRPRPGATRKATYDGVLQGLAYIGKRMKDLNRHQACKFVIFRGSKPIVDGELVFEGGSGGVEYNFGTKKS